MEYVYYFKKNGENIPILTGGAEIYHDIVFLSQELKEKLRQDFPDAVGNLFVHVDGIDFKIDF